MTLLVVVGGVVVIAAAIVAVRAYLHYRYLRTTEWAVVQARPCLRPSWWPADSSGQAAWATCDADGEGYSMVYSTDEAIPVDQVQELQAEWLELHEGEWEFRSRPIMETV